MNAPYNQDVLAAAEACFAQASQLLYCEPDAEVVADQVAERPFRTRRSAWTMPMCAKAWR